MHQISDARSADRTVPDEAIRPVLRQFHNARIPLAYADWGNDGAPVALLIHGNRDHGRSWDGIARN